MSLIVAADELTRDPDALRIAAHASLEHIVDPQVPRDLADILGRALVSHRRGPRDHTEMGGIDGTEPGNELFGHSVGEVLLLSVAGEVHERQHHEHRGRRPRLAPFPEPVREHQGHRYCTAESNDAGFEPFSRSGSWGVG